MPGRGCHTLAATALLAAVVALGKVDWAPKLAALIALVGHSIDHERGAQIAVAVGRMV